MIANLAQYLGVIGIVGNSMLLGAIVPLIKDENGKFLGNSEELLYLVNRGQIMIVGYIMVVSTQTMMPTTGITTMMANIMKQFMALSPMFFIMFVMVFCLVLTNVTNNMMCAILCMPFLVNFGSMVGTNPISMEFCYP